VTNFFGSPKMKYKFFSHNLVGFSGFFLTSWFV